MEQVVIRRLRPGTLEPYRRLAEAKGRSLEAELRDLIENNRPKPPKD
jgi:plasmid stability protein